MAGRAVPVPRLGWHADDRRNREGCLDGWESLRCWGRARGPGEVDLLETSRRRELIPPSSPRPPLGRRYGRVSNSLRSLSGVDRLSTVVCAVVEVGVGRVGRWRPPTTSRLGRTRGGRRRGVRQVGRRQRKGLPEPVGGRRGRARRSGRGGHGWVGASGRGWEASSHWNPGGRENEGKPLGLSGYPAP